MEMLVAFNLYDFWRTQMTQLTSGPIKQEGEEDDDIGSLKLN